MGKIPEFPWADFWRTQEPQTGPQLDEKIHW
jgi:hypothetical protein